MDLSKLNIHVVRSNRKSIAIEVRLDMLLVRAPLRMKPYTVEEIQALSRVSEVS